MPVRMTIVLMLLAACLAGCSEAESQGRADGKVRVVATLFPLADVAQRIGGEHVQSTSLLAPGQTPHGFSLDPRRMEQLFAADLALVVGAGVDDWAARALATARRREIAVLELARVGEFRQLYEELQEDGRATGEAHEAEAHPGHEDHAHDAHEDHEGHAHEAHAGHAHEGDPHVWLDPVFMQAFARAIAAELARLDPAHAADYARNLQQYLTELQALDAEYRRVLSRVPRKEFVTFHPAFTYVAQRYGLEQRTLRGGDAEGFGPQHLEEVTAFLDRHHVQAVFAEPQFPPDLLQQLARRTGATVAVLDPLGSPGVEGYDTYVALMRSNLRTLANGLGGEAAPAP